MTHALNDITSSTNVEATYNATVDFLNYVDCNPDAEILYRVSDMILQVDSDAAYLVSLNAQSRAGGYHFWAAQTKRSSMTLTKSLPKSSRMAWH